MKERPSESEYAPYYAGYVSLVPEANVLDVLDRQREDVRTLALAVPADKETFAYGAGKWTVREVFGHLVDAERVFGYRAFCIGRGEAAALPSFDENAYVAQSPAKRTPVAELADEFAAVRESNLIALRRFRESDCRRLGTAANGAVSARALAFIMAGHVRHHVQVLIDRYGLPAVG